MLLGFKLRRLLWRVRRVTVDLWGAATTIGGAALVGARLVPRSPRVDGGPGAHRRGLRARRAGRGQGRRAPARRPHRHRPAPQRPAPEPSGGDASGDLKRDLELGAALVVATYVTLELSGGLHSPVYPLVYALTAFLVTFHRRLVGLPLVAVTLGLEALLYRAAIHAGAPEAHARRGRACRTPPSSASSR